MSCELRHRRCRVNAASDGPESSSTKRPWGQSGATSLTDQERSTTQGLRDVSARHETHSGGREGPRRYSECNLWKTEHEFLRTLGRVLDARRGQDWRSYARTRTTSYVSAVGGKPVSNFACTTAKVLPNLAAVVGDSKFLFVITFVTVPAVTCLLRRMRVIWLLAFCTAHNFLPASTRPSTFGTLIPATGALAPVLGLTV